MKNKLSFIKHIQLFTCLFFFNTLPLMAAWEGQLSNTANAEAGYSASLEPRLPRATEDEEKESAAALPFAIGHEPIDESLYATAHDNHGSRLTALAPHHEQPVQPQAMEVGRAQHTAEYYALLSLSEKNQHLIDASIENDTRAIQLLLNNGARINCTCYSNLFKYNLQPIHWAAQKGNYEAIQLLLARKASVKATHYWSNLASGAKLTHIEPIHFAATYAHPATIKLLLDHSARVDAQNTDGEEPIHLASSLVQRNDIETENRIESIKILLAYKANPHARTSATNTTPIYIAAGNGYNEIVKLLLAHKADINCTNRIEHITQGYEERLVKINCYNEHPIHNAARHGRADTIELLVANKAHVDAKTAITESTPS